MWIAHLYREWRIRVHARHLAECREMVIQMRTTQQDCRCRMSEASHQKRIDPSSDADLDFVEARDNLFEAQSIEVLALQQIEDEKAWLRAANISTGPGPENRHVFRGVRHGLDL